MFGFPLRNFKNPNIFSDNRIFSFGNVFLPKKKKNGFLPWRIKDTVFLFFLIASFIFIVSCAVVLNKVSRDKIISASSKLSDSLFETIKVLPDSPRLIKSAVVPPITSAQAVLAIDMDSHTPLYEKNPDRPLLPASTTKIITALVAMDYFSEDQELIVSGLPVPGQDMGLTAGEKISVENLLNGLLIYSANDAAEVLAENYPEGKTGFVRAMNKKAHSLNLTNTHFDNPVGFDSAANYSTARDLIRVSEVAMQKARFAEIVGTKEKMVTSSDGRIIHKLTSTNKLLGEIPGVLGVKTGWTEAARENLVTYFFWNNRRIMIAVLGSSDRFGETREIIDWIFSSYVWEKVSFTQDNF